MAKFHPMRHIRKAWHALCDRATGYARRFGQQTDEILAEEPIDFSAPSIPYYENLANRLSFVRIVLYMVLFVFIIGTVVSNHSLITYDNLYYLVRDIGAANQIAQSEADSFSYPISSADADFALYRGGMVIAGGEVVTAMSGSGRQTLSVNVAYATPIVRTSDKYFVTFGRGENAYSVYNAFVQVHRESTEFPVYDATVADNGTYAILTRSRDYTSDVVIYNSDMEKLATYHLGGYVTGMSINRRGDYLGVVSVEARNGMWQTKVSMIRIGTRVTEESVTLDGIFGSSAAFMTDDRFAVVFGDQLLVFKTDATVIGEVLFKGQEISLSTIGESRIALLFRSDKDLSEEVLVVYDRNGRELYTAILPADHPIHKAGGATQMAFGGDTLYIRAGVTLFSLNESGKKITSAAISRDTLACLPVDEDEIFVCTPAYATRFNADDFTS